MSVDDEKVREILSKIGINEDYICENNVGDHGVYDSKNFKLDEVKFVEDIDIDKEKFYDIYSKYIVDVINVIKRNPYMRVYVTADSDNISKAFDNQNVQAKFKNFLKDGDHLDGSNKIVLKTFLDLLRCYSVDDLINNNDTIKKELENGVFDIIKDNRNAFSEEDRENINCSNWKVEDVWNYYNLNTLKERLNILKDGNKIEYSKLSNMLGMTDYLIESKVPDENEVYISSNMKEVKKSEFNAKLMKDIYNDFEIINRKDIVAGLYNYKGSRKIENYNDIPDNMLLHFYAKNFPEYLENNFKNVIVNRELVKEGKKPVNVISNNRREIPVYTELYKKYQEQISDSNIKECINELIPEKTFEITNEDINNKYGYRLDVLKNGSKQLACTTATKDDMIYSLKFAVGFGADLDYNNILLSCDKNADSNLGKESIPYKNKFKELSMTMHEISQSNSERKEILLSRINLKPSYLVCSYDLEKLKESGKFSEDEITKIIEAEVNEAKKLGIDIIQIDNQKIRENMQYEKMLKSESEVPSR